LAKFCTPWWLSGPSEDSLSWDHKAGVLADLLGRNNLFSRTSWEVENRSVSIACFITWTLVQSGPQIIWRNLLD
jgi:hypothetical protein